MQKTTSLLLASFVTIILSTASVHASAKEAHALHLSPSQKSILKKAYQIAKDDGFEDPSLFQGIIYLESHAEPPRAAPGHKKHCCYGIPQLNPRTAKMVLKAHPELGYKLSDREIIKKLNQDPIFAMKVASKYLLSFGSKISPMMAVVAYNTGMANGANPYKNKYALQVLNNSRLIKQALKEDVS